MFLQSQHDAIGDDSKLMSIHKYLNQNTPAFWETTCGLKSEGVLALNSKLGFNVILWKQLPALTAFLNS